MDPTQERLFKQLLVTHRCRSCRHRFDRELFHVVAKHEKLWVVSASCATCHRSQMFWVSLRHGIQLAPSEASPREMRRLEKLPALTSDDVLDMHQFLGEFDGDFQSLFTRGVQQ